MKSHSGGNFHASTSLLNKIDGTHRRFLREIEMSEAETFLKHNFAPPNLRRDIGLLGALHKRVLGKKSFQDGERGSCFFGLIVSGLREATKIPSN